MVFLLHGRGVVIAVISPQNRSRRHGLISSIRRGPLSPKSFGFGRHTTIRWCLGFPLKFEIKIWLGVLSSELCRFFKSFESARHKFGVKRLVWYLQILQHYIHYTY